MTWDDFTSLAYGAVTLLVLIGGYALGLRLRPFLPVEHRTHESLEIVHAVIGMLVAMIAILLGLQLDAGQKAFDSINQTLDRYSINIVQLDEDLRSYAPEGDAIRADLLSYTEDVTDNLKRGVATEERQQGNTIRTIERTIRQLRPDNAMQIRLQSDALTLLSDMDRERLQLLASAHLAPSLSLYIVLLFWMFVAYFAFGLNAAFNLPAFIVLFLSALAVATAVFVLADMDAPYGGLITVSPEPMEMAVSRLRA